MRSAPSGPLEAFGPGKVILLGEHAVVYGTTALAVRDQLQGRIAIIVDGGTSPREVASTIVDLTDEEARWRIMREGAIPAQEISEFFAQG